MSPRRSCSPRSDAGSPVALTNARISPRATTRSSWRTPWPIAEGTAVPGSTICRSPSPAGRRRSASTEDRDDGTGCHADGDALPTGAGVRAHARDLRGPLSQGLGGPRRPQLHQGHAGRLPVVQVVLPDGCLRQLRDEGERLAEAHVCVVSVGRLARPDPRGRSEEHTSELQSQSNLVCRLLLEKKKKETTLASLFKISIKHRHK